MHKLKYLLAFIVPFTVYLSFTKSGIWTFSPLIFAFICVPLIELFFTPDERNFNALESKKAKKDHFYGVLLFLTIPVQLYFMFEFFQIMQQTMNTAELVGRITAFGVLCGIFGINVG